MGVRDQDRHVGIAAVDALCRHGEDPPGGIGLAGLDEVLLLPGD